MCVIYVYINYNSFILNINVYYINNIFWKLIFYLNNSQLNILLIAFITLFNLNKVNKNNFVYFLIVFCLFINNLNIITSVNFNKNLFLNKELYNGLLIIHPIMTYITIVIYINLSKIKKNFLKNLNKIKIKHIKINLIKFILVSFVAMILGSFWAQQELNWGGWWNWDSVEIILLFFNVFILFFIHLFFKKKFNIFFKIFFLEKYIYIFIFYFIVRSNIINSIHAFSISIQTQKYFYLILTIIFLIIIFYYILFVLQTNKMYINFKKNIFKNVFFKKKEKSIYIFYFTNFIIYLITLINIFLYFYKIKFNINVYKYIGIFLKIYIIFIFLFLNKNKFLNMIVIYTLIFYCLKDFSLIFLIITLTNLILLKSEVNEISIIHILIIIIVFLLAENYSFILKNCYLNNSFLLINYCYNNLLINFFDVFKNYFLNFFYNQFFIKNNISILNENYLNIIIKSGTELNFFNSNLINLKNKFLINYIIDNNCTNTVDFFLTILLLIVLIIFYTFFLFLISSKIKNGIV